MRGFRPLLLAVLLPAGAAWAAAEEPAIWSEEPEEPAARAPYIPRPPRFTWQLDIWTRDGAFEDDEDAVKDFFQQTLPAAGYTSGTASVETSGGIGFRFGAIKPTRWGLDLGGSLGYVIGPDQEIKVAGRGASPGSGELSSRVETDFIRALAEAEKEFPLNRWMRLRLKAGLGFALGWIRAEDRASGSFVTGFGFAPEDDYSRSWSGLTWEFMPSLVFEGKTVDVEVGIGYAGFPTMKENDDFNEFEWTPAGLRLGLEFQ